MSNLSVGREASKIEDKMKLHQTRIDQAQNESNRVRNAGAGKATFDESKRLCEADQKKQDEITKEVKNFLEGVGRSGNADERNDAAIFAVGQVRQNLKKTEEVLKKWGL